MKTRHKLFTLSLLLTGLSHSFAAAAAAAEPESSAALIEHGKYIAVAGDCNACHRQAVDNGLPFAGGYAISSPMGNIISSNITPSKQFGIGDYTEQQFADAVRKGVLPKGKNLYPAMPYTSYHSMTDADIHALYVYLMQGVKPADFAPAAHTDLSFPFNIRQIMWGWNLLYRSSAPFENQADLSAQLNRGKYLVDVLAHCSTCHTPRNFMMAEKGGLNLSGSPLGGWYAPNITPDESGIADWSQPDIVTYLKTGHLTDKAQAAGSMAEAVENSFRFMTDDDLNAMAAWIKQVPAVHTKTNTTSVQPPPVADDTDSIITGQGAQGSLADSSTTNGAKLYENACASCHGHDGQGTHDNFYPSLTQNRAISAPFAQNLVMTIAEGIHRKSSDSDVSMPAFNQQLNDAQIASVSNYVRLHFAGIHDNIKAADVQTLRNGGEAPFIMRYLNALMAMGVVIVAAVLWGIWKWWKR